MAGDFYFCIRTMSLPSHEPRFVCLTLNYRKAGVAIREKLALDDTGCRRLLFRLQEVLGIGEAFVLSTCNRTEIYYRHEADPREVIRLLASWKGLNPDELAAHFMVLDETEEAVHHLLRVGIGLESQVLGDLQIINQVKQAYQATADLNLAGPFLHRLLHSIFYINKRIVQETAFRQGSASVSYAAKELAEDLLTDKSRPVVVFGQGETGTGVVRNLIENGFSQIRVCNRSHRHAEELSRAGVAWFPLSRKEEAMAGTQMIISALSGEHFRLEASGLDGACPNGFIYVIDLGIPRSADPAIEGNPRVILYNIDQIQNRVSEAVAARRAAVPAVEAIVAQGLAEFLEWTREMTVSPLIHQIKNSLEQIRREEMARFLRKAGAEQEAWADELTRNMVQRILKSHVVQLKAACKRGEAEAVAGVIQQLFQVGEKTTGEADLF